MLVILRRLVVDQACLQSVVSRSLFVVCCMLLVVGCWLVGCVRCSGLVGYSQRVLRCLLCYVGRGCLSFFACWHTPRNKHQHNKTKANKQQSTRKQRTPTCTIKTRNNNQQKTPRKPQTTARNKHRKLTTHNNDNHTTATHTQQPKSFRCVVSFVVCLLFL